MVDMLAHESPARTGKRYVNALSPGPDPQRDPAPAAAWSRARITVVLIAASIAFATSGPFGRLAAPASPFLVAAFRTVTAALVLFAIAPRRTVTAIAGLSIRNALAVFSAGAVLALHFSLFLWGLQETSLASAITLVSLEPVSVVVAVWLFLGLAPKRGEVLGVALATAGGVVVAGGVGSADHRAFGDLLVLGAVALYGGYLTLARRLANALGPHSYAVAVYVAASLTLGLVCAVVRPTLALPTSSYGYMLLLALVPTLIGHTLVQNAARHISPSLVALVSPGETVGGLMIGAWFLHAPPRGSELAGAALVLCGVVCVVLAQRSTGVRASSDASDEQRSSEQSVGDGG